MACTTDIRTNSPQRQQRRRLVVRLAAAGLIVAGATVMHHPLGGLALSPFAFLGLTDPRLRAGAHGEARTLGQTGQSIGLCSLPDGYTVFNDIVIPAGKRLCEIDFVVVGPHGVFVIENKHYRGVLTADAQGWWQHTLQQGKPITRPMRDPVRQVTREMQALKDLLNRAGWKGWIQRIVVFSNPQCQVKVTNSTVPLLTPETLRDWILAFRPPYRSPMPGWPVTILRQVRDAMDHPAKDPMHIKQVRAELTGRYPWMQSFSPTPPKRYWMRDQVTAAERLSGLQ